jgi:hypothetical protein
MDSGVRSTIEAPSPSARQPTDRSGSRGLDVTTLASAAIASAGAAVMSPAAVEALQRTAGNRAVVEVLQRQPAPRAPRTPALPPPTNDQIAAEIGSALGGPFADYSAYVASMTTGTFLGRNIRSGVRQEFLTKLRRAERLIDDEYALSRNPRPQNNGISSVGGFRTSAGLHGWGIAIDIDVAKNPYVMHEAGESEIDAQTSVAYHRIARFIMNSPITSPTGTLEQSIIPALISARRAQPLNVGGATGRRDRVAEYFDRLTLESNAMKTYFELMNDQAKLTAFLATDWPQTHPNETPPAADVVTREMWEDLAALGGAVPQGGPAGVPGFTAPGAVNQGDRPFKPASAGQQDPGQGFLTIPREVVLGLSQAVSRWGAIDFGRASGDVQHFDDGGGLGGTISAAKSAAEAKIRARAAADAAAASSSGEGSGAPSPTVAPTRIQRRKEPGWDSNEGGVYVEEPPAALTDDERLSGAHWNGIATARWGGDPPNISELESSFGTDLQKFMDMLTANNITPYLTAAFRPKQRSYLFKYCLDVSKGRIAPKDVPAMDGVEIIWDHGNNAASRKGAEDLANSFGLVGVAAHPSNHNKGTAADMKMDFSGNTANTLTYEIGGKTVTRKIKVSDEARKGVSASGKSISGIESRELSKAGADFHLKRALDNDIVHWSRSGR